MDSKTALDVLLSPEQRRKDAIAERRARFIQVMLVFISIIIVLIWVWAFLRTISEPKIAQVRITDARVIGLSVLCAGDILVLEYEFLAEGAGKLVEDATVWIETPPKTIVYSEERPFLVEGTLQETIRLAWPVPKTYVNPATASVEPLPPGDYRRIFAVSSVSRPSVFAIASVDFEIRDSCMKEN